MKKLGLLIIVIIAVILSIRYCGNGSGGGGTSPDSLIYWKNKAKDLTASLKGSELDFATVERELLDSIAKVYKSKTKYIKEVVVVTTEGETILQPADTIYRDYAPVANSCPPQIKTMSQQFKNPYYKADVRIGQGSKMALQSFDTLTLVWKRVKSGGILSRRNYLQADVSLANPHSKVTGIGAYRQEERNQKKVGIGVQTGMDIKGRAYIGIGISYNLIKL